MKRESLLVHWDLEQLSACHKGMELAQDFLIERGAAVLTSTSSSHSEQLCSEKPSLPVVQSGLRHLWQVEPRLRSARKFPLICRPKDARARSMHSLNQVEG